MRYKLALAPLLTLLLIISISSPSFAETACVLETAHASWTFSLDGRISSIVDKTSGQDYALGDKAPAMASCKVGESSHPCTSLAWENGRMVLRFGEGDTRAILRATTSDACLTLEVLDLQGDIDELVFLDVPLRLEGVPEEPFSCTILARNLLTNVPTLPGPCKRLTASCHRRFGFQGAAVSIIACPAPLLRDAMKTVVSGIYGLPHTDKGGPWALDNPVNRGSYLFDFGHCNENTVDSWIALVKSLGMNQIDFHTGHSLRFGDCAPDPELFPNGLASVKTTIDKLHEAGIMAGLHTYACFIDKKTPYVTPVPDPRLAKDAIFTLSDAIDDQSTLIPVDQDLSNMSTITGFFVRNSVTLHIDDELIIFKALQKDPPFAFLECERGAYGTRPAPHAKGARAAHLRECFGLFAPDPDSTLLAEIAANTANAYNTCGFDMIYLDALDGEDALAGPEFGWHYGSKFAFEIAWRLQKPALFEMSTFHHHLWYIRSRMGAWDHPSRAHKRFIDVHAAANYDGRGMFLPMHLGWWAVKAWDDGPLGTQTDPTFPDDIEYLLGKCLGWNVGFSLMGVNPDNIGTIPAYQRLAPLFRRYEELRHAGTVPESILAQLRQPGSEFRLHDNPDGSPCFLPIDVTKHKVTSLNDGSQAWTIVNHFDRQIPRLRIESLMMTAPEDTTDDEAVVALAQLDRFAFVRAAEGVSMDLHNAEELTPNNTKGLVLHATNANASARGAWAQASTEYNPPLNLGERRGLEAWIHGDGSGALLNIQLRSPEHTLHGGFGEHYVTLDFNGWRRFEFVEFDSDRLEDYEWPYGGSYGAYRETVDYAQLAKLNFWLNEIPANGQTRCIVGSIRAIPLRKAVISNPSLKIGDQPLAFPVDLESGCYLEYEPGQNAVLYGPKGETLREVSPAGSACFLETGSNNITFSCQTSDGTEPRVRIVTFTQGDPLR